METGGKASSSVAVTSLKNWEIFWELGGVGVQVNTNVAVIVHTKI